MKKMTLSLLLAGFIGSTAIADMPEHKVDHMNNDRWLRLSLLVDEDGDSTAGFEIGIATRVYPVDTLYIAYGHMDGGTEQDYVLFGGEEYWFHGNAVRPYATFGIGYMWANTSGDATNDDIFFVAGVGGIWDITEVISLFGEVGFQFASEDLWLKEGGLESDNVRVNIGFRFNI